LKKPECGCLDEDTVIMKTIGCGGLLTASERIEVEKYAAVC
jgi:hypothetical protein